MHLRLVKSSVDLSHAETANVFTYENRLGVTYYLHEGRTTTGTPRYFFRKTVRAGAVGRLPDVYEVSESINGLVSVRRKSAGGSAVPESDLEIVQVALRRRPDLRFYRARIIRNAIVVFEPHPRFEDVRNIMHRCGSDYRTAMSTEESMKNARFAPVMKFEREGVHYVAHHMTYRGHGGWSGPLGFGKLAELANRFVKKIGTHHFLELI